jgi:putative ATPase
MPEARLNLGQAVIALALAPKSNAVISAVDAALADVSAGRIGSVPSHLRDAHYRGASTLGHGSEYRYAHDDPRGVAPQRHAPDAVADRAYYVPTQHGAEAEYATRLERIKAILSGG